jgi:hypothetical protein
MPDRTIPFTDLLQIRDEPIGKRMLDERDVLNTWRSLFTGKEITSHSLTKGRALLNGLRGESPLHLRLAKELDDIRTLRKLQAKT